MNKIYFDIYCDGNCENCNIICVNNIRKDKNK